MQHLLNGLDYTDQIYRRYTAPEEAIQFPKSLGKLPVGHKSAAQWKMMKMKFLNLTVYSKIQELPRKNMLPEDPSPRYRTPENHQSSIIEKRNCTVRKSLNSVLKQQPLDDTGLQTVMCEVKSIINNRIIHTSTRQPQWLRGVNTHWFVVTENAVQCPPESSPKTRNRYSTWWTVFHI